MHTNHRRLIPIRLRGHVLTCYLAMVCCSVVASEGPYVRQPDTARLATFNVSFYGRDAGELARRLQSADDPQLQAVAEIIQRVRPDVLLLNEVDYDPSGSIVANFKENYLAEGQNVSQSVEGAASAIDYPYVFLAPSNTGNHSGEDLDRNGRVTAMRGSVDYGGDCWGYGEYPGKYAMVLLSRYPIDEASARTFRNFLWKDMPDANLPDNPETPEPADWYSHTVLDKFPLSSKSHWDVPIKVDGRTVHLLASHPTPPTYDGPEDRNGRRNHDEIRFWLDYITPEASGYIYDDNGVKGGLSPGSEFVIMGDLNGDPEDGQGKEGIIKLLASSRVSNESQPASDGGAEQSLLQAGKNSHHRGDPRLDTLDADDEEGPGNLRVDYVLPSRGLVALGAGVFWPKADEPFFSIVGNHPFPSSDHRLVWLDISIGHER